MESIKQMAVAIGIVCLEVVFFCVSWLDECQDAVSLLALLCFHERLKALSLRVFI